MIISRSQRGYEKSDYRPSKQEQVRRLIFRREFFHLNVIDRNDRMRMNMEEINPRRIVKVNIRKENNNLIQVQKRQHPFRKQQRKNPQQLLKSNLHQNMKQMKDLLLKR